MKVDSMAQRHAYILDRVKKEGNVRVADLLAALDVSAVTIRKDLALLEEKKLLFRTHGNVSLANPYTKDRDVNEKENILADQKTRIGLKAAELIEPDDAIIIASGTTVLQLARAIPKEMRLTVLTSAMNISMALLDKPNVEIVQLGGIVRKTSTSVTGNYAESILDNFTCSKLFLGVDGIDPEQGCTTSNMMEATLNKAMIRTAQKTIILTDSSKFGRRGFGKICMLNEIDQIITDDGISSSMVQDLENIGVEVTIV
ncbi:DeoR/GlpR family DNA-binding transcription regulator [Chitinophaga tropicalis]|nr:DeoR/GlpR family DNA-binding transcription regulator [Chitinophaga tropicalis]